MRQSLRQLTIKVNSLKTRVALLGAPIGNQNAAGPHDGRGGDSGTHLDSTKSTSAYRVPNINGMRAALASKGVSTSHISTARTLLEQRTLLLELMKKHGLNI